MGATIRHRGVFGLAVGSGRASPHRRERSTPDLAFALGGGAAHRSEGVRGPPCLVEAGHDPANIYFDYDRLLDSVHQAADTQLK